MGAGPRLRRMTAFPYLTTGRYVITSPATPYYNCIAWAAGEDFRWWWPTPGVYFWPAHVPAEETVDAFTTAFESIGYSVCADGTLEAGFEKVVIYTTQAGVPTHMARQLPSGAWTSKLGSDVDLEHRATRDVEGPAYGAATRFLKRRRAG